MCIKFCSQNVKVLGIYKYFFKYNYIKSIKVFILSTKSYSLSDPLNIIDKWDAKEWCGTTVTGVLHYNTKT